MRRALVVFALFLSVTTNSHAQRESQIPPPGAAAEEGTYSRKFFTQLRAVFGRFRDSDLQRVFERAKPIDCSELISENGEWRTVAFFNEKRELGDWYRSNLEEVRRDLTAFIFKGVCRGEHAMVQLTTKFPVAETMDAFNQGRIALEQIEVNVNAPVRAGFDPQTEAYTFDLPYLFLVSRQDDETLYSLSPPRLAERTKYATDVLDHWDCKSVTAENVTYQFLICRTTTLPRSPAERNLVRTPAFGASAYFILSDGKEASSSVKLSFGDSNDADRRVVDAGVPTPDTPAAPARWEAPDSEERLLDIARDEFRIRFNPQTWPSRISNSALLTAKQLSSLAAASPAEGADSCVWLPGAAAAASGLLGPDASESTEYAVTAHDRDNQSSTTITFELKTAAGARAGQLQCFFPRIPSALSVTFGRWASIVGPHLAMEVRP
jgi:hypothetical protein